MGGGEKKHYEIKRRQWRRRCERGERRVRFGGNYHATWRREWFSGKVLARWDIALKDRVIFSSSSFLFLSPCKIIVRLRYSSSIPRGSNGIMERLAFDLIRKGKHDRIEGDETSFMQTLTEYLSLRSLIATSRNWFLDNPSFHNIEFYDAKKSENFSPPPDLNQKVSFVMLAMDSNMIRYKSWLRDWYFSHFAKANSFESTIGENRDLI